MGERFMRTILDGDRASAIEQARLVLVERGLAHVYEELVRPALEEIGSLWEDNRISVADEHVASAVVEATMAALYPDVAWPARGRKALVAGVAGEHHTIGALMLADLMALDGWDDVFLGGDVPAKALAEKARDTSAVVVALSASMPARLPALRMTVEALREIAPDAKIIVGGRVMRALEQTPAELGVDAVTMTAVGGVHQARRWHA
jgi:methanogenic corrinoid protein MtbC1